MSENSIYADIAKRTGGDIYIGVVGPVRTGKSTFIHRFLDTVVMPNIENEYDKQRTQDEMPQSASGKTIMTTEPKFVPDEAVRVRVGEDTELNVKMVDCVGYMVEGAVGAEEEGEARMVLTPWSDKEMPFAEAAELGTSKVIGEHATIAMLVTTDGTIAEIPREAYIPAEERVVAELRERGKPFAIILNSAEPNSDRAHELARELEEKYSAPVALVSCPELNSEDIKEILALVLGEFPIREMSFSVPDWFEALPADHPLIKGVINGIKEFSHEVSALGDIEKNLGEKYPYERISVDAGEGVARLSVPVDESEYFRFASEAVGREIGDLKTVLKLLIEYSAVNDKWKKVEAALAEVDECGYGIVRPERGEVKLDEPRLEKSGSGFGARITAHAESIHMIKTDIKTDVCPVIGSEEQAAEVVKYLNEEYADDPDRVWDYNMFGRSLYDMVKDGMEAKLENMPRDSRERLGETLGKIINEGSNGLICILL
ncbi:MAG: stage IV sporulation protein A [Clostridia bacterium]|nr:stage IV sporulation protein A [Clostridia bacterium]